MRPGAVEGIAGEMKSRIAGGRTHAIPLHCAPVRVGQPEHQQRAVGGDKRGELQGEGDAIGAGARLLGNAFRAPSTERRPDGVQRVVAIAHAIVDADRRAARRRILREVVALDAPGADIDDEQLAAIGRDLRIAEAREARLSDRVGVVGVVGACAIPASAGDGEGERPCAAVQVEGVDAARPARAEAGEAARVGCGEESAHAAHRAIVVGEAVDRADAIGARVGAGALRAQCGERAFGRHAHLHQGGVAGGRNVEDRICEAGGREGALGEQAWHGAAEAAALRDLRRCWGRTDSEWHERSDHQEQTGERGD